MEEEKDCTQRCLRSHLSFAGNATYWEMENFCSFSQVLLACVFNTFSWQSLMCSEHVRKFFSGQIVILPFHLFLKIHIVRRQMDKNFCDHVSFLYLGFLGHVTSNVSIKQRLSNLEIKQCLFGMNVLYLDVKREKIWKIIFSYRDKKTWKSIWCN